METVVIKKELFRNEQEFLVKHIYQWNPEIEQTNKDNNLLIVGSPWVYFLTEENLWVFDRHIVNGVLKKESKEDHLSDYEYEMEHEFDYFCSCNDFLQKSYLKSIEFSDIPEIPFSKPNLFEAMTGIILAAACPCIVIVQCGQES